MAEQEDDALRYAIIEFYREEIDRRYQLDNLRRFEEFSGIPDSQANELRQYFMTQLYPPIKDRERLDDALNRLSDVLHSPRRVRPLMKTAITSMWKMGASLPAAVSAGRSTLDAYLEARKLEDIMVNCAQRIGVTAGDTSDRDKMVQVIGEVPERDVMRLVKDILKLFRSLSNTKMLKTAVEFLDASKAIMASMPEIYNEGEIEGISVGKTLVQGGLDLFEKIDKKEFPNIIKGIEAVEIEWYREISSAAHAG